MLRKSLAALKRLAPALAFSVAACTQPAAPQSPFPPDTRAVFAGERARELVNQCSRREPGPVDGTWTPSDAQLDALESRLPHLFEERPNRNWPKQSPPVLDYYRQYGGLLVGGRRIIYVNAFRPDMLGGEPTWREAPVMICDGGATVFGVEYDPATGAFAEFSFNGPYPLD
jgi:hypothetical protein